MAQIGDLEALAKRHGATSYRNRADTQNPDFGFSAAGLESLLAEVRKQDDALILQLVERLERADKISGHPNNREAIKAGRARLEGKSHATNPIAPTDPELLAELGAAGVDFMVFRGGPHDPKEVWVTAGSQDGKKIAQGVRAILAKWGGIPV